MMTPFGPAISTYSSKHDFYAQHPTLAKGWNPEKHPGLAPLGWDLVPGVGRQDPRWLVVFCGPAENFRALQPTGPGTVVTFDRTTNELHVLVEAMDFPAAKNRYQS